MKARPTLRVRVTLLFSLVGLMLSLLFAGAVVFIAEDYEGVLVEQILKSHAADFSARLRANPATDLPKTSRMQSYLRRPDGSGEVPVEMANLAPGIHESAQEDSDGRHFGVFDTDVGRLYFSVELRGIEVLEWRLAEWLIGVVVLGTLISAWLGWLLAGLVVRPVRRLADAVAALPTSPMETALAQTMAADELGRLGQAIDDYQRRLFTADATERAFFADASHELRTPIAVVRGATELLIEDAEQLPSLRPRLSRLDRGVRELSDLLDALLRLARRRMTPPVSVDLVPWVMQCLQRLPPIRRGLVELEIEGAGQATLPVEEMELVLLGIARHLISAAPDGRLSVRLKDEWIAIRFSSSQLTQLRVASGSASDRGLGVTLMGRLASASGWQIDEQGYAGEVAIFRAHQN